MSQIAVRPLNGFCAAFLVWLTAVLYCGFNTVIMIICTAVCTVLVTVIVFADRILPRPGYGRSLFIFILAGFAAASIFAAVYLNVYVRKAEELYDKEAVIEGFVYDTEINDTNAYIIIKADRINGDASSIKIKLTTYSPSDSYPRVPHPGDKIKVKAALYEPTSSLFGYDEYYFLRAKGVLVCGEFEYMDIAKDGSRSIPGMINSLRTHLSEKADDFIYGGFIKCVIFGDKSELDGELKADAQRIGTSHLFAVSGLHISIFCGALYLLLEMLGVHRKINCAAGIAASVFYIMMCGCSSSALRAGLMLSIYYLSIILRRDSDALGTLLVSGTIICLFNVYSAFDIGFQLSFLSTLGIITGASPFCKWLKKKKIFSYDKKDRFLKRNARKTLYYILSGFAVSIAAVLFSLPVSSMMFSYAAPFSPLYNTLLIVIFTPVIYCAVIYYAMSLIALALPFASGVIMSVASIPRDLADFFINIFSSAVKWISGFDFISIYTGRYISLILAAVTVAVIIVFVAFSVKPKFFAAAPIVIVLLCSSIYAVSCQFMPAKSEIYAINTRSEKTMIIESGNKYVLAELTVPGYNTDRGSLKALAADRGITEAEAYIVSELNVNLYKRFLELIKTIKIKTVYVPHPESIEEIESLAHIGKYCNNNHIELEKYRVGDNIDIFGGKDGIKMLESENGSASVCEVALAGKKIIYSRAKEKGELLTLNSECFAFIECGKGVPVIGAEGKTHFCAYDPLNANIGAPQPKGCECADMSKIKYIYLDLTSGEIKVSK